MAATPLEVVRDTIFHALFRITFFFHHILYDADYTCVPVTVRLAAAFSFPAFLILAAYRWSRRRSRSDDGEQGCSNPDFVQNMQFLAITLVVWHRLLLYLTPRVSWLSSKGRVQHAFHLEVFSMAYGATSAGPLTEDGLRQLVVNCVVPLCIFAPLRGYFEPNMSASEETWLWECVFMVLIAMIK
eukprot:gnl/TRDRNA2_/TRDRNA2_142643_c0_seq2.p1 gnl/TRDRNA2_/TRDRNA2_142643_c0~~gnl/TRDRNA2_/TRDRNA2_142643_c0_seq2.p1  ORF type:complete len:197 (-),score=14.78 gnl/TRDRNA2_/TRDRNA2_142643_c0_seq2:21-575(-)